MKINPSRKSTHSIMNNQGYGNVTVIRNGHSLEIPRSFLFNDGRLKKYAISFIDEYFTNIENEAEVV